MENSDFIVYVDESGDHGLQSINPQRPVFVLSLCTFRKDVYINHVTPSVQHFKFKYWGHDNIILHTYDIRKARGDFSILRDHRYRNGIYEDINQIMRSADYTLIASVINKERLKNRYAHPDNPYSIALLFCLERLQAFLKENNQADRRTFVLFERRGKKEDDELELEFRRIIQGANFNGEMMANLDIRFVHKTHNSTGLQFADLVAYPIGQHAVKPDQPNRAYEIIQPKFWGKNGKIEGWGLKNFP